MASVAESNMGLDKLNKGACLRLEVDTVLSRPRESTGTKIMGCVCITPWLNGHRCPTDVTYDIIQYIIIACVWYVMSTSKS